MENKTVMTRSQAHDLRLHKYWTGRPCAKGHNDFRYTGTGACVHCIADYQKKYRPAAAGTVAVRHTVPRAHVDEFNARVLPILVELSSRSNAGALPLVGMNGRLIPPDEIPAYIAVYGEPIVEDRHIIGHLPKAEEQPIDAEVAAIFGLKS